MIAEASIYQDFSYAKVLFQRGLGIIYFIAYLVAFNQGVSLIGRNGLTPMRQLLTRTRFRDAPSLFHFASQDAMLRAVSLVGLILSSLAVFGVTEQFGYVLCVLTWLVLWLGYLSIVNVGQVWYGYGWEIMLLESGFLSIFLGPSDVETPSLVIWLLRWVCFRNMLGAGLIKWRGDSSWRDLTCMYYHYETQPIPNPLSIYFHRLPRWMHRGSVILTFFVELIVPFGLLAPWWEICAIAGIITIGFHLIIIASGNLAWLNYLSIVLCFPCFNDEVFLIIWSLKSPPVAPLPSLHLWVVVILAAVVIWKSYGPVMNLLNRRQAMNRSFDRWHIVNTYGAFGSITKTRHELVVLGTLSEDPHAEDAHWITYEFKAKPTDLTRRPPMMSPYLWKLDWQMWFAAFGTPRSNRWVIQFVNKLLQADPQILSLLYHDPFKGARPRWIKIKRYRYYFADPSPNESGDSDLRRIWLRDHEIDWLPPTHLDDHLFQSLKSAHGWS